MRDITNGSVKPDEDVVFYDGFLYIISMVDEGFLSNDGFEPPKYDIDVLCLNAEYDEPISLKEIVKHYPKVEKVLFEDCLRGAVFNYKNHSNEKNAELWEKTGETLGYA